jgi:hypothetical protein
MANPDTASIFYKIGQLTNDKISTEISNAISNNNTSIFATENNFTAGQTFSAGLTGTLIESASFKGTNLDVDGGIVFTTGNVLANDSASFSYDAGTLYVDAANVTNDIVIGGNLTVNGTTTTLSTTNSSIEDNVIELSDGAGASYTNDAGFFFNRGSSFDNQVFIWDHSDSKFVVGTADSSDTASSTTFTVTPGEIKVSGVHLYDDSDVAGYKNLGDIADFSGALYA